MTFLTYMFAPTGQPWYTGAFWSNQTQWFVVTLPSLLVILWRIEKHHKHQLREIKKIKDATNTQKSSRENSI